MTLKETLISKCYEFASERKRHIDFQMQEIKEALFEEIKSTAGDKHETGRAMLQLEREKVGNQFYEVENMFETLNKIDVLAPSLVAHLGSIVYTTQANYFIAISAGKLEAEGQTFYAISSNTPIGKLLMAQSEGEEIKFRNQRFRIKKID